MHTHQPSRDDIVREVTATLIIRNGKDQKRIFKVFSDDQILTIGLLKSNDIVLKDKDCFISRTHAAIVKYHSSENDHRSCDSQRGKHKYFIRDLGSSLGTKVNGSYVRKKLLKEGDEITVGDYTIMFTREYNSDEEPPGPSILKRFGKPPEPPDPHRQTKLRFSQSEIMGSIDPDHQEFFSNLERTGLTFDIDQKPDEFLNILAAGVKFDKALIGHHDEGRAHIDYQFGLEREGRIRIEPKLIERLQEDGHVQEEGLIMIPYSRNRFLVFIRTEKPAFNSMDLNFLGEACRRIEKMDLRPDENELHTPWPIAVVGLYEHKKECLRIAKLDDSSNSDVLFLGETGAGKEMLARFIHQHSHFSNGPFIIVNCASLPETLLYGELFGWEKGAHHGAHEMRKGYFEQAEGGTLFLDEIGDLPENIQVALLTAMQTRKIKRLGHKIHKDRAGREIPAEIEFHCRIIAATDRDIESLMKAGIFRQALRKRFAFEIALAPLRSRDRKGEIPILSYYFLDRYCTKSRGISREALQRLRQYDWPGNARELQNVIRKLAIAEHDIVFSWDLPIDIQHPKEVQAAKKKIHKNLRAHEKEQVMIVVRETRGNKVEAAKLLGIARETLYKKLDDYGIPRNYGKEENPTEAEQDEKSETNHGDAPEDTE